MEKVYYDDQLFQETPPGEQLVGFADNLVIVVMAKTFKGLEMLTKSTLVMDDDWIITRGLQIAHQEMKAIILIRK